MGRVRARHRVAAGFTIVELIIVVVLIAILATITIVTFKGIQDRAKNVAMLSTLDNWEKAIMLQSLDRSGLPLALTAEGNPNIIVVASPTEIHLQMCLPGNYPAVAGLPEGACAVLTQTGSTSGEILKMVYVQNTLLADELGRSIGSKMPTPRTDNIVRGTAIGSSDGQTVTVTFAARGAMTGYTDGLPPVVGLQYFIQGDQVCGRGEKSVGPLPSVFAMPGEGEDIEFTSSATVITSCSMGIEV